MSVSLYSGCMSDFELELALVLKALLNRYIGLINSGDCGSWDPETEPEVIRAREALSRAKCPHCEDIHE